MFSGQERARHALRNLVTKMAKRAANKVSVGYQVISRTSSDQWCQEGV